MKLQMTGNVFEKCVLFSYYYYFPVPVFLFHSTYTFSSITFVTHFGNDKLFWQSFKQLHSFVCLMSKMALRFFFRKSQEMKALRFEKEKKIGRKKEKMMKKIYMSV